LAQRLGSNFQLLSIDGFDEVMEAVSKGLLGYDRFGPNGRQSTAVQLAFDERIMHNASTDDLDMDLALTTLRVYCEKLGRAALTRDTLPLLMREQGLLVPDTQGRNQVTNAAILLFGGDTQRFLPQAVVVVTEGGKKREIYAGNLIAQHRNLLEKVDSTDVNPMLKLKKRRSHNDQTAYS
jgi:predicted HTH transcriptional regulator